MKRIKRLFFYFPFALVFFGFFVINNLKGQCLGLSRSEARELGIHNLSTSSGNSIIDQFYDNERQQLERVFQVHNKVYFTSGGEHHNGAFCYSTCLGNCQSSIGIGIGLISDQLKRPNSDLRLAAIFAHEFAHSMQYRYQHAPPGKQTELHADFLAGFYIAQTRSHHLQEDDLVSLFYTFHEKGDEYFYHPDHHGTPNERGCAAWEGYSFGLSNSNIITAFNAGISYVRINYPCYTLLQNKRYIRDPTYTNYGTDYSVWTTPAIQDPYVAMAYYGAVAVALVGLVSNDFYLNLSATPIYSRDNLRSYGRYTSEEYKLQSAREVSFGFRKHTRRGNLEYGVSTFRERYKNSISNNSLTSLRRWTFDFGYYHNIRIRALPYKMLPYVGCGFNSGAYQNIHASIGFRYPLLEWLHIDSRMSIGSHASQFKAGLVFTYQQEYFWNK